MTKETVGRPCPTCGVMIRSDGNCQFCTAGASTHEFRAEGEGAMAAQTAIVNQYSRMAAIRAAAPYAASVLFVAIAALLIVFAPESRTVAANMAAAALMILAAGIAGYTRFAAKAPGLEIGADRSGKKG